MKAFSSKLPWDNPKKWKQGYWYPCPTSFDIEFGGKEITIRSSSWDVFQLDPRFPKGHNNFGDIDCMGQDLTFVEAVKLANQLNPEHLWQRPDLEEWWSGPKPIKENL